MDREWAKARQGLEGKGDTRRRGRRGEKRRSEEEETAAVMRARALGRPSDYIF